MTYDEQTEIIKETFKEVMRIRETKGREYAQDEDTLADFKEVAAEAGVSPMQCWLTYERKHARAIGAYVRGGAVLSEPIEGRIYDTIVYHLLLLGLIEDARRAVGETGDSRGRVVDRQEVTA